MSKDPVRVATSRLAIATRWGKDEDTLTAARRDLTEAKLERAIREAVASAPPLTPAQRDRLATLLTGGAK